MGFTTDLQDKIWNDNQVAGCLRVHQCGINGTLQQLIELLNEKPSILLAPKYLHDLPIDFDHKIAVAGKQALGHTGITKENFDTISDGRQYIVILIVGMSATWMTRSFQIARKEAFLSRLRLPV